MKLVVPIYFLIYFLFSQDTLVIIENQIITKNDFIKRSEYTIRPTYCNSDKNLDKKIILNSLIAEKLLAIKNKDEFDIDETNLIQGIKEQAMRKVMLENTVNSSLVIDENKILDLLNKSLYDYKIDFITINHNEIFLVNQDLNLNKSYKEIIKNLKHRNNQKYIKFEEISYDDIYQEFYTSDINVGDIIGPIKTLNDNYILINVLSKKKNILIDTESQKNQYENVKSYLIKSESYKIRKNYIQKIMKGKTIEFNENSFFNLADYFYDQEKKPIKTDDIIFTLANRDWSIEDLIEINKLNPVLFREPYKNKNEFYNQFKLSLVDLIQNYFLTKKAYELNLSSHPAVVKEGEIWSSYLSANSEKDKIINANQSLLKNLNTEYEVLEKILNKELEILFVENSDKILIDVEMFNGIKLSNIDMLVINTNQPYQLNVPPFPRLTTKNNLDYGTKKDS
tara:strand:+ start:7887 stop:9242 length:1356 start_codon:yes stop_codon:yes gene_type:complete